MNHTQLYAQILGLASPWQVAHVALKVSAQTVHVFVEYPPEYAGWTCPTCQHPVPVYDHREPRSWRHLDSCQFQTFLVASLPRVHCPEHGVQTVSVSWSEPHSRFTHLFERFALEVFLATKAQSQAARLLRLSAGQVHDRMQRAVARGLSRRDHEAVLEHLSLDEKSFHAGHQYVTVLSAPRDKRVLDVIQDRTQEAAQTLLESSLSVRQRVQVRSVSMAMWAAFAAG